MIYSNFILLWQLWNLCYTYFISMFLCGNPGWKTEYDIQDYSSAEIWYKLISLV